MAQPSNLSGTVCAVIVSHNAGSRIDRVVDSLAPQVGHIVVVDNASEDESRARLRALEQRHRDTLTLILNDENEWLAAALNQGIRWAETHDYDYVLFSSDADLPGSGAVSAMLDVFSDPAQGRVGSVNPKVLLGSGRAEDAVGTADPVDIELLVTGGCLVSMEAIRIVGPQREDFLVDMIDYDYGFRLQQAGFRTVELPSVSMRYELGRTTTRRFLWRSCSVHNYAPIRRYYFARNGLTLVRESHNRSLSRSYRQFLFSSVAKILLYETDKASKLGFIGKGLWDSVNGRLGPYEG